MVEGQSMRWSGSVGSQTSISEKGCALMVRARSPFQTPMLMRQAASALICCLKLVSVPFFPPVTAKPIERMNAVRLSSIWIVGDFCRIASLHRCNNSSLAREP